MPRQDTIQAAVIGDIVRSSNYSRTDRVRIQDHLLHSWARVQREFKTALSSRLGFRVAAGDEFEFVCRDAATALEIVTWFRLELKSGPVRPPVMFRAAIGTGRIFISGSANPYSQDGPAFHLARESMDWLKKQSDYLTFISSPRSDARIHLISEILPLLDYHYRSWTPAQAEAILLARKNLNGEEIARNLKVSRSAVSQRLRGTNWEAFSRMVVVIQKILSGAIKVKDLNIENEGK